MKRRHFLLTGVALGCHALVLGCPQSTRRLLATDTQPDGYPTVEALKAFALDLNRRTSGRLTTTIYSGGQLGSQNDTLELAQFGGVDFVRINAAPLNVVAPLTLVPVLPFIFRSIPHMRAAMDGAPGEVILASLADHDLIGLCFYDSGARSIYTTSRLIREPRDMKGLKIRVQTSDLFVSMIEALGGDATPMSYGEVYQGLVQGVIDGAENNFPSYESSRHFEVAKFYSLTRHVMAPEVLAMSKRRWDRLSAEDQDHVRAAAKASVLVMRRLWDARVEAARRNVLAADVEVAEIADTTAFVESVQPVWRQYLKEPGIKRLTEDIHAIEAPHA